VIIENENLHPAVVEVTQNTYPPHYIPPEIPMQKSKKSFRT